MVEAELNTNFSEIEYEAVEFTNHIHPRLKVSPMYFELGFSSSPLIYGRNAVLHRLFKVISLLPKDYGILIWDVYRPRAVQAKLFNLMVDEVRKNFPYLTEEEQYIEVTKYISPPAKIGEEYCSPHLSGGAIDLTIYSVSTGEALNMGTDFDDFSDRAHRDYFTNKAGLSIDDEAIKERRKILCESMEAVGFTSYLHEWWHFDIGTIFWSKEVNRPAVFGPLFGDEELPQTLFSTAVAHEK